MKATWLSNTPMGRSGKPEDLQGTMVYLASDASSYVSAMLPGMIWWWMVGTPCGKHSATSKLEALRGVFAIAG